jgi:hypothetical protein
LADRPRAFNYYSTQQQGPPDRWLRGPFQEFARVAEIRHYRGDARALASAPHAETKKAGRGESDQRIAFIELREFDWIELPIG